MTEEQKPLVSVDVLAERVKGLTDLTQVELRGIKDTLARIEQSNLGFATKQELEEAKKDFNKTIQDIRDGFVQHNVDDKKSFEGLSTGQQELRDIVMRWGGGLAVILIVLNIAVPLIIHYWLGW